MNRSVILLFKVNFGTLNAFCLTHRLHLHQVEVEYANLPSPSTFHVVYKTASQDFRLWEDMKIRYHFRLMGVSIRIAKYSMVRLLKQALS